MSASRARVQTQIRIPEDVFEALRELAGQDERRFNQQFVYALRRYLKTGGTVSCRTPDGMAIAKTQVRIPVATCEELDALAHEEGRTRNEQIVYALTHYLVGQGKLTRPPHSRRKQK